MPCGHQSNVSSRLNADLRSGYLNRPEALKVSALSAPTQISLASGLDYAKRLPVPCPKVVKLDSSDSKIRIGLLRHFPVVEGFPSGWLTAAELHAWRTRYEVSSITPSPPDLDGVGWQVCIASDLTRARQTAAAVFPGSIQFTPLLREVEMAPFRTGPLRLPIHGWKWLYRFAWLSRHPSQRSCREDLNRRIQAITGLLLKAEQDTLVVSHAGVMHFLARELRRAGFTGPKFKVAEHARAYTFKRHGLP